MRKLSDPQRVLDGEGGLGCHCLASAGWLLGCREDRCGGEGKRRMSEEGWGCGEEQRGERKIGIWSGRRDKRGGGREIERGLYAHQVISPLAAFHRVSL